jgi:hypothetical protein
MGVAAATIKPKFELTQPPRRFGYLYNAVVWALFPGEHPLLRPTWPNVTHAPATHRLFA